MTSKPPMIPHKATSMRLFLHGNLYKFIHSQQSSQQITLIDKGVWASSQSYFLSTGSQSLQFMGILLPYWVFKIVRAPADYFSPAEHILLDKELPSTKLIPSTPGFISLIRSNLPIPSLLLRWRWVTNKTPFPQWSHHYPQRVAAKPGTRPDVSKFYPSQTSQKVIHRCYSQSGCTKNCNSPVEKRTTKVLKSSPPSRN